jgi:hypothetical protein
MLILSAVAAGCSGKKDFSKEQSLLSGWSFAIKNRDYAAYSKLEAHPRSADQFLEMYKDYYPADIAVVSVSKASEEKNDADLNIYVSRTVDFGLNVIMRKDNARVPSLGSVVLVEYKKQPGVWLIADKTIMRSE